MPIETGTLADIRRKFITETGRFDLVVDLTDYADNGANFYIQAGSRWLEMHYDHQRVLRKYQKSIVAGIYNVQFKYLRAIDKVEINDGTDRWELKFRSYDYIRENYAKPVADIERGKPVDYAISVHRLSPELKDLQVDNYTSQFVQDWENIYFPSIGGVQSSNTYLIDWIEFYPPSDRSGTIIVTGWFFDALEDDDDRSWYSVNMPEVLVLASKLALYQFYDNSAGVRDMQNAIDMYIDGLDRDKIQAEVALSGLVRKGL